MRGDSLNLIFKALSLLRKEKMDIFQFTKDFSREYKYTVGESLKNQTVELLTLIFRANSRKDKDIVLQEARESIEVIRLLSG